MCIQNPLLLERLCSVLLIYASIGHLLKSMYINTVSDVICCQGSFLSSLEYLCIFSYLFSHHCFHSRSILEWLCIKKKTIIKALWLTYVNVGRYILKINIGSVPLLFPCQRPSSIIGPGRAVNGLINSQSRALGGRCLDCVGVCW